MSRSETFRIVRGIFRLRIGLWGLIASATTVVIAFTATGFLGRLWWLFDLTANFRVQYMACLAVAAIAFLVGKKWLWAAFSGVFALINFVDVLPSFIGEGAGATSVDSSRILLANVLSSNKQYDKVRRLIHSLRPDIIVLHEVNEAWMKALSSIQDDYPHVVGGPREDNFGIALFSRLPVQKSRLLEIADAKVPTIIACLQVRDREVTIVATHPLPPVTADYARRRNSQLEAVANYIRSIRCPVILVGDLNTSPWSPHFKRVLHRTGLRDSRRGRGIQATWPVQLPLLRFPVDHCLHSPEVAILRRRLGPKIGSDHFPVIVDFWLTER